MGNSSKRLATISRIFVVLLLLTCGVVVYFVSQLWETLAKGYDDQAKSNLRKSQVHMLKEPFTILLIGTDQRSALSKNWRPDVLILLAINPKKQSAKILSIPRDLLVPIANSKHARDKINAAAYYGYLYHLDPIVNIRQTIENYFKVPIDHYAKINFQGFTDLVNILGGIQVHVKKEFRQQMIGGKWAHFQPGFQHLNGAEALAYVRMRKQDPLGDNARNERQREVMSQLIDKLVSFRSITHFHQLMKAVGNNLTYSFQPEEFLILQQLYHRIPQHRIETVKVSSHPFHQEQWYEIMDKKERQRLCNSLRKDLELPAIVLPEDEKSP
ncbi:LCP family protein [Thermoflavimicrobium dichotomicum]|uniref:Cell envelope-related function transcriptional attenuator common domain-containing protein n=1 Tax=Thermoflavimicrobium dichotomicum TaxID=46223 RepID=A0A1I3JZC4_9BACL|nr:LCP family protein [Thermoflavimicrobium dichotomicum]SFI65295.1 cell envelope-related function transcriptional attenuator common domain-containing protein [Thermoflavimicrobium dichotomicum]